MIGVIGGAVLGSLFFFWIAGPRVIDPSEYAWLMKLDWRINFLGWHLFRNDPWHLPPGIIDGYLAGEGTTIGFTDSVPLAALLLKPFDVWLPTPFQYFGVWLLLCFALQGAFGALIVRVWTRSVLAQLLGAMLFVLAPTLLMRVGHPALTAHFLLLWALWLYLTSVPGRHPSARATLPLGLAAGLTHPYLAAMTLAVLASVPLRDRRLRTLAWFASAVGATLVAWWAAGFVSVSSTTDLSAGGLGLYSMNLLSPVTPQGWSVFLPEQPVAHEFQAYEGFQYLGAGVLALLAVAVVAAAIRRRPAWSVVWPVAVVCTGCALYALSPRVTLGEAVVVDWTSPAIDRFAFFRASGRFFWPMTYLLISGAIALVVSRLGARVSIMILAAALGLQVMDQRNAHAERRATSRSDAFHHWPRQLLSPTWDAILPLYDHLVMVPASQCGGSPFEHEELAFMAGLHGLTINSGLGARWDETARRRYCGALEVASARGEIDDRSVYVVSPAHARHLQLTAPQRVVCGGIDTARVCVSVSSRARWPATVQMSE